MDVFTSPYAQSASCFTTVVHHTKVGAFTKSPHCVVDPLQPEFKTTSFTTQRWTSSPVPTRRARPGSPPSFTTQRWTSSPTRTRRARPVSLLVVHMLWASSPARRLHAMGVVTSSSTSFGHADACCPKEFYLPHELYHNYDVGVVGSGKPRLPPVLARVAGFDYTTFDL